MFGTNDSKVEITNDRMNERMNKRTQQQCSMRGCLPREFIFVCIINIQVYMCVSLYSEADER